LIRNLRGDLLDGETTAESITPLPKEMPEPQRLIHSEISDFPTKRLDMTRFVQNAIPQTIALDVVAAHTGALSTDQRWNTDREFDVATSQFVKDVLQLRFRYIVFVR
jgi:hypothetical protein